MASEPASPTAPAPDGASVSASAMPIIRGITRGGGRWAITDAAGIRTTDGARGAGPLSLTSTAYGATPLIRALVQLGPTPTQATTAQLLVAHTTTPRLDGRRSPGEVPTPTSTPA